MNAATTATINGRQMTVIRSEPIEGQRIAADLVRKGYEACFYTLQGKRGGLLVCLRSAKSGQFVAA